MKIQYMNSIKRNVEKETIWENKENSSVAPGGSRRTIVRGDNRGCEDRVFRGRREGDF